MMMSRLVFKLCAFGVVILVTGAALALWMGLRTPAHVLVYIASEGHSSERQAYMLHLERELVISVTHRPVMDINPQVSPDGHWLVYQPEMGENRFSLVNLHTWETGILPVVPSTAILPTVLWFDDPQHIGFVTYGERNRIDQYLVYKVDSDTLIEVENFDDYPFATTPFRPFLMDTSISLTVDGSEVQQVTTDENGLPRFYDADSGIEQVAYRPSFAEFATLTPDQEWFVVPMTRDNQRDLYLVPVWEGEPIQLTDDRVEEFNVNWSWDSRYIVYLVQTGTFREFHVMDMTRHEVVTQVAGQTYGDRAVWIP